MTGAAQRTAVADLLTAAKDDLGLRWREIEAATGIRKATREGWFRRSTAQPPLGQVAYLAQHLGVDPRAFLEAAVRDYRAVRIDAREGNPASPSRAEDLGAALAGQAAAREARKPRGGPRPHRSDQSP